MKINIYIAIWYLILKNLNAWENLLVVDSCDVKWNKYQELSRNLWNIKLIVVAATR